MSGDVLAVVAEAVRELDLEHAPFGNPGKDPMGCHMCWPKDGHWPCTSRLIADDIRAALATVRGTDTEAAEHG